MKPAPTARPEGLLAGVSDWLHRAKAERELRHLDARLLRDIGIEPHQLAELSVPTSLSRRLLHL